MYKLELYNSPNFYWENIPRMIIIHHWGSDAATFGGTVNHLCNPTTGVSAHYVAQAGRVAKLLSHNRGGWHCVGKNTQSIGIECAPLMTSGDIETVAELIANIWKEEGKKLPLYGHKDFNVTACPGRWYNKLDTLKKKAEGYYNGKPLQEPEKPKAKAKLVVDGLLGELSITALQKWVKSPYSDGEISGQLTDLYRYYPNLIAVSFEGGGSATVRCLQALLIKEGYEIEKDGYLGKDTITALQKYLNKKLNTKLAIDGILGPATAQALQKFLNTVI